MSVHVISRHTKQRKKSGDKKAELQIEKKNTRNLLSHIRAIYINLPLICCLSDFSNVPETGGRSKWWIDLGIQLDLWFIFGWIFVCIYWHCVYLYKDEYNAIKKLGLEEQNHVKFLTRDWLKFLLNALIPAKASNSKRQLEKFII